MPKFRHFEESRVRLGVGEIHIQEVDDGVHLTIEEEQKHSIRLGIPDEHGTTYNYWTDIIKKLTDQDTIFSVEEVEMADSPLKFDEEDEKKEDASSLTTKMRPELIQYEDKGSKWIGIKLVGPGGDTILVSWETETDMPIPSISFNLDLIKKANKISRKVFYKELQTICNQVLA
ncbi:MAG: hypothetical protein R3250_07165 [Melioribacteraceae bacterium]|nr:hypothetical protein [Melioribacteraceae bacterium]